MFFFGFRFIASIRLAFHQRNWEGVPRTFGNTDDPQSFAALYQHLIMNFDDSNKIYQPIPLLKKFIQEYLPQYTMDHVMNTYWDSEFLFDKLLGHFEYTVDPNNPDDTIARTVVDACPAFSHMQPLVSTVKTRPYCCRENRVEKIATQGYINIVMAENHDFTIQDLVEQQLNETRVLNDGFQCPHCHKLLPQFEMSERLVESISALPTYLRNMDRIPIEFGEDITIESLSSGPIQFSLIGSIQFTGRDNHGHVICHLKHKNSGQFWTGNDSFPWYPSNLNWIKRSVFFLYARKNNDENESQ